MPKASGHALIDFLLQHMPNSQNQSDDEPANCTTVCSRSSNTGRHRLSLPRSLHSPGCHRPALPKKNSIHLSIFLASQAKKKPTGAATKTYATFSFTFTNGISFCWIFQGTTKALSTRNPPSHFYQPTIHGKLMAQ